MTLIWGRAACMCRAHEIKKGDMLVVCSTCGGVASTPLLCGVAQGNMSVTPSERNSAQSGRAAVLARIVAWLRAEADRSEGEDAPGALRSAADAIENGELDE